jgi:hypothetical protein
VDARIGKAMTPVKGTLDYRCFLGAPSRAGRAAIAAGRRLTEQTIIPALA